MADVASNDDDDDIVDVVPVVANVAVNAGGGNDEESDDDTALLNAFVRALDICGITNRSLVRHLVEVQGLDTLDDFASLSLKEISDMITSINKSPAVGTGQRRVNLVVSAVAAKRLKGLREWVKWQTACGKGVDALEFDEIWMKWATDRMDYESRLDVADDTIAPKPEVLKNVGFKAWTPWWRQMTNYCGTIRGTLNVPISYILRESNQPDPNILSPSYDSTDEALMACLSLTGEYYQLDNAKIWDIVEACTNQGNAWPFIKQLRKKKDGRAAIQILRMQAEGTASTATRKMIAYKLLDTTKYDGKGRFTFDQYIEKLQLAFCELAECGDPQSESHQIHVLITNCHSTAMKSGIDTVANDEDKYDTFIKSCAFLQGYCARNIGIASADRRNVSSTTTGNTDSYSDLLDSYPPEDWRKLPQATKNRVVKCSRERKAKDSAASGGKHKATPLNKAKRKIKALQSELKEKASAHESDSDSDDTIIAKNSKVKAATTKARPHKKA